MNRILFFLILMVTPIVGNAQGKQFDLDDLIPGGKTYSQFVPKTAGKMQWCGDQLTISNRDTMYVADPKIPGKKTVLLTNKELRKLVSDENANINKITFREVGHQYLAVIKTEEKSTVKEFFIDPVKKQIVREISGDKSWENINFCPQNKRYAFTIENNLFVTDDRDQTLAISNDPNKAIVYGQPAHRNEFGIHSGTFWSPSGNFLAFYRMDESMVEDYPLVDISAREAKLKAIKYPMAGMKSHEVTIGIYNLGSGKTIYLKTGYPKDRYFTNLAWSPDEKKLYIAELNRGQDTCTLNSYNVTTGSKDATLFQEMSNSYVEPENPPVFLKQTPGQFIWQSKRDGYNHLYLYRADGTLVKQLTSGNWDVLQMLGFDEKEKQVFILSNEKNPIETQVYKVELSAGVKTQLTKESGIHDAALSASGKYILDKYSNLQTPLNIDLIDTDKGKTVYSQKAPNPYTDYVMPEITLGSIKAADGVTDVYYRLVKPTGFDPSKKYPAVIYVYGGPHSQMVKNSWLGSARGWDIYMAQRGYVVFSLDNRGTSNRGVAFENVIHRNLGVNETADQMKGVEFLQSLPFVDAGRMGVHGWSFGGFMTTNMILRHPDVFKVAVAGGAVIDWQYYEIMYGERYMDTPQDNKDGYANCNLNNLAGNLQGHLLLIHGDEDPTVVWQHSLSFLKSCIQARTYPDYFVYPGHGHNVMGIDRVHLHEKITRYFDDYLK